MYLYKVALLKVQKKSSFSSFPISKISTRENIWGMMPSFFVDYETAEQLTCYMGLVKIINLMCCEVIKSYQQ